MTIFPGFYIDFMRDVGYMPWVSLIGQIKLSLYNQNNSAECTGPPPSIEAWMVKSRQCEN